MVLALDDSSLLIKLYRLVTLQSAEHNSSEFVSLYRTCV